MARCMSCGGVIAKKEVECYVCGEPVPGTKRSFFLFRFWKYLTSPPVKAMNVKDSVVYRNSPPSQS